VSEVHDQTGPLFFRFDPSIAADQCRRRRLLQVGLRGLVIRNGKSWDEMWIVDTGNDEVEVC